MKQRYMGLTEYQALIQDARVLQEESFGVKVWRLRDGRVLKLFRTKGRFTSARLWPYNLRFARNAARLRRLGFRAPEVFECVYCPAVERHGALYRWQPGRPLADLLEETPGAPALVEPLARLLVQLHEAGVYFRSVHPGNVLLQPDGGLALIDVQDVRFRPWRLRVGLRARNFRHLFASRDHSGGLRAFGFQPFVELYLQQLPPSAACRRRLAARLLGPRHSRRTAS